MKLYLGIDAGTTNVKAALFDLNGKMVSFHSEKTPVVTLQNGWSQIDPGQLWDTVKQCIREAVHGASGNKIVAAGVSSMGESGTFCDDSGKPLYPFITWYDTRSRKEFECFENRVGSGTIYEITGQIPSVKYGVSKMLWIREIMGDKFRKARHWVSVEDWVIYCMTGEYATDYSIASRTLLFDIRCLDWSGELMKAAGLKKEMFPAVYPGGTVIGRIMGNTAMELGLNQEILVAAGGHDHACAGIAVNILKPGVILDSMGTSEVLMTAADRVPEMREMMKNYFSIYPHCGKRLYRIITSNQSCGASVEWYINTFYRFEAARASENGVSRYDCLPRILVEKEPDSLYYFPFLRGSAEEPELKGVFWGLEDGQTKEDYYKALLEGLCFEIKNQTERQEKCLGIKGEILRTVGGLCRSEQMMEIKCRIQEMRVEVPAVYEAACCGAALLGAMAAGDLTEEQLDQTWHAEKRYEGSHTESYRKKFGRYLWLREKIKNIYHESVEMPVD